MPSTQQHLRQLYRAARGLAATALMPDRHDAQRHRAALRAELSGDWAGACALWFEHSAALKEIGAPHEKAGRNLAYCALKSARDAENAKRWIDALQCWDYLRTAEPGSDAAAKGIERCARHLAIEIDDGKHEVLALKHPLRLAPQAWKVDVLLALGRAREAEDQLAVLESMLGESAVSLKQRAQISLHSGRFPETADAARRSIELLRAAALQQTADCLYIWAEALCDQGLDDQARATLIAHMPNPGELTDRDFAALFLTARNRDELEEIRNFLDPVFAPGHKSRSGALKQYSIALRDLGFGADAQAVACTRLMDVMAAKPFGHTQRIASEDWSMGATRALLDLKADLDVGGFPFFLISGTLLGAVRENRVLPQDKDLDVGIAADVDTDALRAHLRSTGRFRIRPLCVQTVVRAIHANGTSIDIFQHWLKDGHMVHQGQKAKWLNTPFAVKPYDFLGTSFQVPADPELYLAENYSDWKTPVTDFDTVVDTPNMVVTDRDHLIWYYYNGLHDYYARGCGNRFAKLWAALKDTAPVDASVSSKIVAQLAALNSEKESRRS